MWGQIPLEELVCSQLMQNKKTVEQYKCLSAREDTVWQVQKSGTRFTLDALKYRPTFFCLGILRIIFFW